MSKLIHYHIFKNAGTSVDAVLRDSFGNRWGQYEGPAADSVLSPDQIREFLDHNDDLVALSTHQGRPEVSADISPILFLRHPILRARSVYEFSRQDRALPSAYQSPTFADYVAWALDSDDGGIVIRDYQVTHLSNASFRTPLLKANAHRGDLEQAQALLTKMEGVGIVEQFGRSALAYQALYRPIFSDLDFGFRWENATGPKEDVPISIQLEDIRLSLGDPLFERLVQANMLDLELYAFGLDRFSDFAGKYVA